MIEITSNNNPIIKLIKSLHRKKERWSNKLYLIEGKKMILEAVEYNVDIKNIVISESFLSRHEKFCSENLIDFKNLIKVPDNLFSQITTMENSEGILGMIGFDTTKSYKFDTGIYFYLDGIQDPGNLGTIIRSCDAFSLSGIIIGDGTTDPYSPKVVRSSMGSIFRTTLHFLSKEQLLSLKHEGFRIISTTMDGSIQLNKFVFSDKDIVVVGNEGKGVSDELLFHSDLRISIPMKGDAESLNAGVAASIVMYHATRS